MIFNWLLSLLGKMVQEEKDKDLVVLWRKYRDEQGRTWETEVKMTRMAATLIQYVIPQEEPLCRRSKIKELGKGETIYG